MQVGHRVELQRRPPRLLLDREQTLLLHLHRLEGPPVAGTRRQVVCLGLAPPVYRHRVLLVLLLHRLLEAHDTALGSPHFLLLLPGCLLHGVEVLGEHRGPPRDVDGLVPLYLLELVGGQVLEVGYLGEEAGRQHRGRGIAEGVGHLVVLVLCRVAVHGGPLGPVRGPFDVGVLLYQGGALPAAHHRKLSISIGLHSGY